MAKRVLSGVFWVTVGSIAVRVMGMIASIIVARILGRELFGEFGIIRNTATTFMTFASLGLGLTATRYVAELRNKDPVRLRRIIFLSQFCALVFGLLVAGLVFYFASVICTEMLNAPHLIEELRVASGLILLLSINGAQLGALSGFEAFSKVAKVHVIAMVISLPFRILLAVYFGVLGAIFSMLIEQMVCFWLARKYLATFLGKGERTLFANVIDSFNEYPVLLKFSIPAAISGIMVVPVRWFCSTVIVRECGFSEMGLFTAAMSIQIIVLFIGTQLNGPLLSIMSNLQNEASEQLQRFNMMASWISASFVVITVLSFIECSEWLYGSQFSGRDFRIVLSLVMMTTSVMAYKQGLARLMAAKNLMWFGFASNAVWAIAIIFCTLSFRRYGAIGLSLAYLISYVANTLLIMPIYFRWKLAPRETLLSKYTIVIWVVMSIQFAVVYFEAPFYLRSIQFLVMLGMLVWASLGIFNIKMSELKKVVFPSKVI